MSGYDPHDPAHHVTYALSAEKPAFLDAYGENYIRDKAHAYGHAVECWAELFIPAIRQDRGYKPIKVTKSQQATKDLYDGEYRRLIADAIRAIAFNTGRTVDDVYAEILAEALHTAEKEFDARIARGYEKK